MDLAASPRRTGSRPVQPGSAVRAHFPARSMKRTHPVFPAVPDQFVYPFFGRTPRRSAGPDAEYPGGARATVAAQPEIRLDGNRGRFEILGGLPSPPDFDVSQRPGAR